MTAIAEAAPTTSDTPIVERPVGSFPTPFALRHTDLIPILESLQQQRDWLGRINFYEMRASCKHVDCFRLVVRVICEMNSLVMEISASNAAGCISLRRTDISCDRFGITVAVQKHRTPLDLDVTNPLTLAEAIRCRDLTVFLIHLKAEVRARDYTRRPQPRT